MDKSATIKAAYIGGAAVILAAVIGGIFILVQPETKKIVTTTKHQQGPTLIMDEARDINITIHEQSSATEEAIKGLESKLKSTEEDIKLTRKEVSLLTEALKDLDQRTSGIEKLPDGRTRFGGMVSGEPTVIALEHNAAVEKYNAREFQKAFDHSSRAIGAYEATKRALETRPAGLSAGDLRPEGIGKIYYFGALNSQHIGNNDLACEWARKAVQANPTGLNRGVLATALFNIGKKEEAQIELAIALERDPNNNELIRLKNIIGIPSKIDE